MNFAVQNRDNHIIGIQLSGSALHYFKNQKFTIDEGCIYFLNQKDDYKVDILEKGVAFSIHFTTYEPIDTDSFCTKTSRANEIVRLLSIIEKDFFSKRMNSVCCRVFMACVRNSAKFIKNLIFQEIKE